MIKLSIHKELTACSHLVAACVAKEVTSLAYASRYFLFTYNGRPCSRNLMAVLINSLIAKWTTHSYMQLWLLYALHIHIRMLTMLCNIIVSSYTQRFLAGHRKGRSRQARPVLLIVDRYKNVYI